MEGSVHFDSEIRRLSPAQHLVSQRAEQHLPCSPTADMGRKRTTTKELTPEPEFEATARA